MTSHRVVSHLTDLRDARGPTVVQLAALTGGHRTELTLLPRDHPHDLVVASLSTVRLQRSQVPCHIQHERPLRQVEEDQPDDGRLLTTS